jgi:hypothetical protein
MRRLLWAAAAMGVLGLGLACAGGETATSTSLPSTTAPGASKGAKLSKPLNQEQAKAAKEVAQAKAKNGQPSPDGSKKLQVERKKKKTPSGEVVWVIVEEWVLVADWHDEIWVVDEFVDEDDVLVVELVDFEEALIEELAVMEVEALEQALAEEIVGAAVEQAVEEAIVEEVVNQAVEEAIAEEVGD